jgi:hypothetical protein
LGTDKFYLSILGPFSGVMCVIDAALDSFSDLFSVVRYSLVEMIYFVIISFKVLQRDRRNCYRLLTFKLAPNIMFPEAG